MKISSIIKYAKYLEREQEMGAYIRLKVENTKGNGEAMQICPVYGRRKRQMALP